MEIALIVALVLFLAQVIAWAVLPGGKQVAETSVEFSSLGDETHSKAVAGSK